MIRNSEKSGNGMTAKRYMFIGIFLFASTLCFAQNKWNLEFYGGVPLFYETSALNGPETNQKSTSLSIGIAGGFQFTDLIGIKAYVDYFFPLVFTSQSTGSGPVLNRDQYDFLFGFDELIGVVFNLVRTERLIVPITVGSHSKFLAADIFDYTNLILTGGIGLAVGAEFKISDRMYIFGRVRGSFDFFGFAVAIPNGNTSVSGQKTNTDISFVNAWGFSPNLGIGFRF
jgi:hypothetical protein